MHQTSRMQKFLWGVLFTILHGALTTLAFLWSYGVGSDHFEGRPVSLFSVYASEWLSETLKFPLVTASFKIFRFPGLWGYMPILLNSALWVTMLMFLFGRLCRVLSSGTKTPDKLSEPTP